MKRVRLLVVVAVAVGMVSSIAAAPVLGAAGPGSTDADLDAVRDGLAGDVTPTTQDRSDQDRVQDDASQVSMAPTTPEGSGIQDEHEAAVERGVENGLELVQAQGVEVTQEQRSAAIDGALAAVAQHQTANVTQIQNATQGAVHGALIQQQSVNATQVQAVVGGATAGALSQHQSVNATQLQSAAWGAGHGTVAQAQNVTVEQLQVTALGAAAGAAHEAGETDEGRVAAIQEAAQGAAYGVLEQYQTITVEQRQRITIEHVQHAAAGASAGAVDGAQRIEIEQIQRVTIEQFQRVTIKEVQQAAMGAAKGAIVQRQRVSVEQTQAAARGAAKGACKQAQRNKISVRQVQKVSVTQIQEAALGAAKGSIAQSQAATVEQIQAAATGGAEGALVQTQRVSVVQTQHAASGAAKGAVTSAVQHQVVEIEQIQAAARGASQGAVTQIQIVSVVQIQILAQGSASGAVSQSQEATAEQVQSAARSACEATARTSQRQRVSVTQLQTIAERTAADTTSAAAEEGLENEDDIADRADDEAEDETDDVEELTGEASVDVRDQETDGETVTVEAVDLSEGGFVAIHDQRLLEGETPESVLGVSGYLEAGTHQEIEIDLEETLESDRALIAVVHHDTDGDEAFGYVEGDGEVDDPYVGDGGVLVADQADVVIAGEEPDGEPDEPPEEPDEEPDEEPQAEPVATLSVDDQTGNGTTLTVTAANASVEYYVDVHYDGETVESETLEGGEDVTNLTIDLEPPIEDDTTVDVAIHAAEDGEELTAETIEYDVLPTADLEFDDQESDGERVVVAEANLSEGGFVAIHDETVLEDELGEEIDLEELDPANVTAASVVGNSTFLEAGEHENVTVELFDVPGAEFEADSLEPGEHRLVAIAHRDTNASETFDYVNESTESSDTEPGNETDRPYVDEDGIAVADDAAVAVEEEGVELAFLNCTAVEATGQADDLQFQQVFYESEGVGDVIGTVSSLGLPWDDAVNGTTIVRTGPEADAWEREDGTRVIQIEDRGAFGDEHSSIIGGASAPGEQGAFREGVTNPDREACEEDVRPERPELAVENATVTDDGIDVTFGYDNPNDAPLQPPSAFVEGTTDDEPPETLEPGEDAFTVTWTPESDDERLVWELDLTNHGYEEPATAATEPAGEFEDPTEPAAFEVTILDATEQVTVGDPIEATVAVENVGGEAETQDVTLAAGEDVLDTQTVALEAGATETLTLGTEIGLEIAGEYELTASTANDSASTMITVAAPAEPADFVVTDVTAPETASPGDEVFVQATIENQGEQGGTQTVTYAIDGEVAATTDVTLEGGESIVVQFSWIAPEGQAGSTTTHAVETNDDSESTTIDVVTVAEDDTPEDGGSDDGEDAGELGVTR